MQNRQNALQNWLESILSTKDFTLVSLAGDASFRRYFRLHIGSQSYIVMDSPPHKEPLDAFLTIGELLQNTGIHTPKVKSMNLEEGFLLLEDFGDQLLLSLLNNELCDTLYQSALDVLTTMQSCPSQSLPPFNRDHMQQEISLFTEWFLSKYLQLSLDAHQQEKLTESFNFLINEIELIPRGFIHRDFHSRNLMVVGENPFDIGVIDFQDAMEGPFTYDLVSLLKDCYIQWPREKILQWLSYYYNKQTKPGLTKEAFIRAFDLCGLQRHIKVLGIFCRLHYRDNKPQYLNDLPLVFNYVLACLELYPELEPLHSLMINIIFPRFQEKIAL